MTAPQATPDRSVNIISTSASPRRAFTVSVSIRRMDSDASVSQVSFIFFSAKWGKHDDVNKSIPVQLLENVSMHPTNLIRGSIKYSTVRILSMHSLSITK